MGRGVTFLNKGASHEQAMWISKSTVSGSSSLALSTGRPRTMLPLISVTAPPTFSLANEVVTANRRETAAAPMMSTSTSTTNADPVLSNLPPCTKVELDRIEKQFQLDAVFSRRIMDQFVLDFKLGLSKYLWRTYGHDPDVCYRRAR